MPPALKGSCEWRVYFLMTKCTSVRAQERAFVHGSSSQTSHVGKMRWGVIDHLLDLLSSIV
jgi:hypothetical protein